MQFDISDLQFISKEGLSLFCCALLCVLSSFAIILNGKGELIALLLCLQMSCYCKCYLALPQGAMVCLQCVIVVFPDHTHLLKTSKYQEIEVNASITSS